MKKPIAAVSTRHGRLTVALALRLFCLAQTILPLLNQLRPYLLPDRRAVSMPVFIAETERRTRPHLRPIHLILPITGAQILIFVVVTLALPSQTAIFHAGILNLLIAALAMLPSFHARMA